MIQKLAGAVYGQRWVGGIQRNS